MCVFCFKRVFEYPVHKICILCGYLAAVQHEKKKEKKIKDTEKRTHTMGNAENVAAV